MVLANNTLSLEQLNTVAHLNLEYFSLFFIRFLLKNELFTIVSYKVNARRKNRFVMTEDETLFQILACLLLKRTVTRSYVPLILGCPLDCIVQVPNVCKKQVVRVSNFEALSVINHESIVFKCVVLDSNPLYLAVLPNLTDRD